ncbi:metallophosphoesterase family protein [Amorphus coralli]|uniref:metallophosphoesterase family protein n=1 Tax=Amorphus coralli TaxID=340680 RepID=UPI001FDF17EE|nr:metallophosphoesterase family protein [Amorphus coralli]
MLADIHGNVLALEAVLADLEARGGADFIVDLGDRASGPLWPRETLDRLAQVECVAVRGNHDRQVATLAAELMNASDRYTLDEITDEQRQALGGLPEEAWIGEGILALHASPASDTAYLLDRVDKGRLVRDRLDDIEVRLAKSDDARIVLTAHSHRPDMVRLPGGPVIVNPGSVGCPAYDDDAPPHVSESGSPHARYAIVTPGAGEDLPEVLFVGLRYDHEAAAQRAEANARADWAHALRTGFMPPA